MIQSVIAARDKHLKPVSWQAGLPCASSMATLLVLSYTTSQGGVMWPSHASLFLCPCSAIKVFESQVDVWQRDVYGFDFSCLQ